MTDNHDTPESGLVPGRKLFFWLVTLSIPVVTLTVLEIILRLFNYGGTLDLVVSRTVGDREEYVINRSFAQRYFPASGIVVPEPAEDTFMITKTAATKRIFCIGESTMAGFPYDFHATAPSMLAARLRLDLPDYNIEVINAGLSAVSSFVLVDMLEELLEYKPDLIIVYSGHNEFYGAFGTASSVGFGSNQLITRLAVWLTRFKIFLVLRDFVGWAKSQFGSTPQTPSGSMMSEMIGDQKVIYGGPAYQDARFAYQENLRRMIELGNRHNVPILFSALVSNLRDHPPFQSAFTNNDASVQTTMQRIISAGDSLLASGNIEAAVNSFTRAVQLDSGYASGWYKLARALDRRGKTETAAQAYRNARDFDVLRFRATTEFESDLQEICEELSAPIARVDQVFEAESRDGIPGKELFTEHLHPNIRGYALMAESFHSAIRNNGLFLSTGEWAMPAKEEIYQAGYGTTVFDTLVGRIKTDILTHQWPFVESSNYRFHPGNGIEAIVHEYIRGRLAWSEARYTLAEYFAQRKQFEHARKECLAVSRVIPFSYEPLLRVADYYRQEGLNTEAMASYRRCIEIQDNPYARLKLAILLLEREMARDAVVEIERAFAVSDSTRLSLSPEARANARYLLAVAYAKSGILGKARDQAEQALRYKPSDPDIMDLLRQIRQLEQSPLR
ncbi:MAG: tetratricopeptide repeat protein [Bacteroidota bacterium]